jgi:hypothetical protein
MKEKGVRYLLQVLFRTKRAKKRPERGKNQRERLLQKSTFCENMSTDLEKEKFIIIILSLVNPSGIRVALYNK